MLTKFNYLSYCMLSHFIKTVQNATDQHVIPEAHKLPILLKSMNAADWAAPDR